MAATRRFVLTGCASGIGRRLAADLLAKGERVMATDLDLEALAAAASADQWPLDTCQLRALDVRDGTAWQATIDEVVKLWNGVDVVMNIAGFLRPGEIRQVSDEDVHLHLDVNTKGVVFGTRAAARQMVQQGTGHIINIASLASLAPVPGLGLYAASKYAVRGFSLAAAQELRAHGVALTVVCPDAVRTPMLDLQLDYPEAAITFTAPRFLTVDDLSRVILGKVLKRRPLMVSLPWHRALLARLADLFPRLNQSMAKILQRQGLRRQQSMRLQRLPAETPADRQ